MAERVIRNVVVPLSMVVSGLVLGGIVGLIVRGSGVGP